MRQGWKPSPGWVYVLTNPAYPGCCKIGGTGRTATHRARELVNEYGPGQPFSIAKRFPVSDWPNVEAAAHRMLSDRRLPRSELFRCSTGQAARTIKAAARAYDRPGLFRRLFLPRPSLDRPRPAWRRARRGTNWLPLLLGLAISTGAVAIAKPDMPAWVPVPIARTVLIMERLR